MFYHILEVELSNGTKLTCFDSTGLETPWKGDKVGEGYYFQLMHEILGLDCQFYPFNVFTNELKWVDANHTGYEHGCAESFIESQDFAVKLINRDHIISISSVCDFEIADGKYY